MPNGGFSWGAKLSEIADAVWGYANRTLTQAKFPWWSAIITQMQGTVSVPASTTVYVDIKPPTGETWTVEIAFNAENVGSNSIFPTYYDFDGVTRRKQLAQRPKGTYGDSQGIILNRVLTNNLYASLGLYNGYAESLNFTYGYSGFKLSQPQWSGQKLNGEKPFKRLLPANYTLAFPQLVQMAYLNPDDELAYHLGTEILTIDPTENEPVETVEYHVTEKDLLKGLVDFKDKPKETGWEKIFLILKQKGISL